MKDVLNLFSAWPSSEYHLKILAYLSLTMIVLKKKDSYRKKAYVYVCITKTLEILLLFHYNDKICNLPRGIDFQICSQIVPNVFRT